MTNPFGKVRAGDPLNIPAIPWNELLDMLSWFKSRRAELAGGAFGSIFERPTHVEFICDDDLSYGQAVWLEEPKETISPPSSGVLDHATRRFVARPIFRGTKITDWDASRTLGLVSGMKDRPKGAKGDRVGVAVLAGCAVAYMNEGADGGYIRSGDGGCEYADSGFAQVIWPPEGDRPEGAHLAFVRFAGEGGCYSLGVKVLDDEDHPKGLYERFSCDPDTWVLVISFAEGHCPYTPYDPLGGECDLEGYDPGPTWLPITVDGWAAAWEDDEALAPPPDPPGCTWIDVSWTIPIGEGPAFMVHKVWSCPECDLLARGAVYEDTP